MPGVTILDPPRWWESLRVDVAACPGVRRDYYGAVRDDLRRLHALKLTKFDHQPTTVAGRVRAEEE